MDLKDDEKSLKLRNHPQAGSRYFESNAGHLFVNNVNPFNTVGGHAGDVKQNHLIKRKNDEFIDIFDNTPTKEPINTPSKELVNEVMQNCPFNRNIFMNDPYDEIHEALFAGNQRSDKFYSQPIVSMSANLLDTQYTSCSTRVPRTSRYEQQVRFEDYNDDNNTHKAFTNDKLTDSNKPNGIGRAEKTTYCRPLLNMYNQEFVYKTMQRNARLQKLVRKLVIAREREKQREAWNNYINDLKNKHRYYSNEPSRISPQYVPDEHVSPELIEDFYNTRFSWRQSNPCQHLLQDFYGAHNSLSPNVHNRHPGDYNSSLPDESESYTYDNNRFCYPTSSQANLLKWNRDRQGNQFANDWRTRPAGRYFRGSTIVVEKERDSMFDKIQGTTRPHLACSNTTKSCSCKNKMCSIIRSSSKPIQTEKALPLVNEEEGKDCCFLPKSKQETSQYDNDIYFPYKQENPANGQSKHVPDTQDNLKQEKDVNIPSKDGTLDNTNVDVKVPPKEETVNTNVGATVLPKEGTSNKNMDVSVSQKEETLKNKKDAKQNVVKNEQNEKDEKRETLKEKFKRVTDNISKLKNKIRDTEEDTRLKSLATIEEKIDCLMKSINSIMVDIKAKKTHFLNRKSTAVSCAFISNSRSNLNRHRSDPFSLIKNEEYLYGMVRNSSRSLTVSEVGPSEFMRQCESSISKMDKILLEEMNKSNKVKRDIEELLNLRNERNCSVQITFDIPTKERSTEVTDSLSKARKESGSKVIVEEIPSEGPTNESAQMTIAVNTDPLGLLALLRVSTETVKQLLSYVPNLNYYSYLSMLPMPSRRIVSHYICNICGAAFGRPSQLSDHIEQHNLGRTRDCCVCRHSLDLQRTNVGLFTCRYCGQRFTRAYCCELHQQTCARNHSRCHDVNSSHVLLR